MRRLSVILASGLLLGLVLVVSVWATVSVQNVACLPDNAGLTLPDGFCAVIVADEVGRPRHLTVAPNGDVFVALGAQRRRGGGAIDGGVLVLRDTDGDGVSDESTRFGGGSGDDVEFHGEFLYYSTNDAIMRYPWRSGQREPTGAPDTVVMNLPASGGHRAKSIAFLGDGWVYSNVGSPSNACMQQSRTAGSPGKDPCDELETRAGIWRFRTDQTHQVLGDGERFATGLRNTVALASRSQDGRLYGVMHGRDQLSQLWPERFTTEQGAEKPAEEFVRITRGDDFGWPYCYYDPETDAKVLTPEYGGDGTQVGRCAEKRGPLIGFPAHWAPNGLVFYSGTSFPAHYRGGAFIAFHGSWNRAPLPQGGYQVVFAQFVGDEPTGEWEAFAVGFAGDDVSPRGAEHRPVGVAQGPDGALYVSDDAGGRIYRIVYTGR